MKKVSQILIILLMTVFTMQSARSQQILPPFDSTWYGFNTQTGSQNYFLKYAKLVDVDNDGDSDVVASKNFTGFSGSASGFVVIKNSGNGFFDPVPFSYTSLNSSDFIETADLNNDGYADVIVANTGGSTPGNSVSVYLNQGNGIFGTPVNYSTGSSPVGITAADFNNDGKIDLAVANYGHLGQGSTISLLINNGNGFNSAIDFPAGAAPYRLLAAKINSDNLTEIVVANRDGKINVLVNSGGNDFSNRTEYTTGTSSASYISAISIADMDNDGDMDEIYSCSQLFGSTGPAVALFTNQNGILSAPQIINLNAFSSAANDIKVADLNNDGWKDIITTSSNARNTDGYQINFSNGSGGFLPAVLRNAGQNTNTIMTGDINNDGKTDVLTTDSYSMQVTVHKNQGNGNFPSPVLYPTGSSIGGSIDAADIDGDGDLDIIVSASGRAATGVPVIVMKNLGNGVFDQGTDHSIRGGGVQAKFRDLNGDHIPDILYATAVNSPPYDFHYAINNGDGTFGPVQTKSIGSCGWYDIDAADVNNDGTNDVIITEWLGCPGIPNSSRRIYICQNLGNAVFAAPVIKAVGPNPGPIGIADFNGDGKLDIVTGVSGANLEINMGLGNGDFMAPAAYSIGSQGSATDIIIADFNNDNKADIASCNFFDNYWMSVMLGNGDGTFQPAQNLTTAYSPDLLNVSGITCGDIDNDGDLDIIVGNNASNTLSLYYNNNGVFEYKMRAGGFSGMTAPFYGDFDNDGKGDVASLGSLPPSGMGSAVVLLKGKNTGITQVSHNGSPVPHTFVLAQNYPNPFNPATVIKYDLRTSGVVTLKVFNIIGQQIAVLADGFKNAGTYEVRFNAENLPSGVYFYTIKTKDFTDTKKMLLVK